MNLFPFRRRVPHGYVGHTVACSVVCGALLSARGVSAFLPFAGVEEFKPQRLHQFCGEDVTVSPHGHGNLRSCGNSVRKTLEDGGDVHLEWRMDVDPDRILSLDTELEHGVRMRRCDPDAIELELPEEHAHFAEEGRVVVASRFAHICEHLGDKHMYHRVTAVHSHNWSPSGDGTGSRRANVRLAAEPLASLTEIMPHVSFSFSYMPAEARDVQPFPEMRTDYGLNRRHLFRRRLLDLPVSEDDGGFQSSEQTHHDLETDSFINFQPKQISNFGWNWDFLMNATEQPEFRSTAPGAEGVIKLRKPFAKMHAGLYLNFSSRFLDLGKPPLVQWTAGSKGHGQVSGRLQGALNSTSEAEMDPLRMADAPMLAKYEQPKWFEKIDIATGNMPLSVEPGFQMKARMYHRGPFQGAVAVGGKTHGTFNPTLSYDSLKGFRSNFEGHLEDATFWPPMWMIFTKAFELGVQLEPTLMVRGDFAGFEKATVGMEGRPFLNVTVQRDTDSARSDALVDIDAAEKTLTVYPFRVVGLADMNTATRYRVRVHANGNDVETGAVVNWGEVQFREHVSKFDFGDVTLKNASLHPIEVALVKVDAGKEEEIGRGKVECTSLLDGVCQPSPAMATIMSADGQEVAAVDLAILWDDRPSVWFARNIRGVSLQFPQIALRSDIRPGESADEEAPKPFSLKLIHGGCTYTSGISGDVHQQRTALSADAGFEFTPSFLQTWAPCRLDGPNICRSSRLEIYHGDDQVAVAEMPQFIWAAPSGTHEEKGPQTVPSTLSLYRPGSTSETLAVVKMLASVTDPLSSSVFLSPRPAEVATIGSTKMLKWAISGVDPEETYAFTLSMLVLLAPIHTQFPSYKAYARVGDQVLKPIENSKKHIMQSCRKVVPSAPCIFEQKLEISGDDFMNADEVVVLVRWSRSGAVHELYAPPMFVSNAGGEGAAAVAAASSGGDRAGEAEEVRDVAAAPAPDAQQLAGEGAGGSEEARTSAAGEEGEDAREEAAGAAERRRQGAPAAAAHFRRLWTRGAEEDWKKDLEANAESCKEKDLKFGLGAGMRVRGRLMDVQVPDDFPEMGGLEEDAALATPWQEMMAVEPGTDAQELLPEAFCMGGLCQGALPGCRGGEGSEFKEMHFPTLVFNFSRPMYYDPANHDQFEKTMKEALAYTFSALPEMVDLAINELGGEGKLPYGSSTTAHPSSHWWSDVQNGIRSTERSAKSWLKPTEEVETPVDPPTKEWWMSDNSGAKETPAEQPKPHSFQSRASAASNALKRWWSGQGRRLRQIGRSEQELGSNQAVLTFKAGLPYKVDAPLLRRLLQGEFFEEIDDGASHLHGPLKVVSLSLKADRTVASGPPPAAEKTPPLHPENVRSVHSLAQQLGLPATGGRALPSGFLLLAAAVGGCLLALFLPKAIGRSAAAAHRFERAQMEEAVE